MIFENYTLSEFGKAARSELKYYWRIWAVYAAGLSCIVFWLFAGLAPELCRGRRYCFMAILTSALMVALLLSGRFADRVSYRASVCLAHLTAFPSCFLFCAAFGKLALFATVCVMSTSAACVCRRLRRQNWGWLGHYTLSSLALEFVLCIALCLRHVNGIHGATDDWLLAPMLLLPLPVMLTAGVSLLFESIRRQRMLFDTAAADRAARDEGESYDDR